MRCLSPVILVGLIVSLGLSCAPAPEPPPFRHIAGTRLVMSAVMEPAADLLWDSVGTVITEEGTEEIQPQTSEEWTAVRNSAVVLAESANLLMMESRAVDQDEWIAWCQDLIDASEAAMKAAEAQSPQKVFDTGGEVYVACRGCHAKYWAGSEFMPGQ